MIINVDTVYWLEIGGPAAQAGWLGPGWLGPKVGAVSVFIA